MKINNDKIFADLNFEGKISEDETIINNEVEIGKILINEEYPFALVKYMNENFDQNHTYKSKKKTITIDVLERTLIQQA